MCALVAFLNAAAWSFITPPFQVPDEQSHYAYTEYVAQHGRPPAPGARDRFSTSQTAALKALEFDLIRFRSQNKAIWTPAEAARLERDLRRTGASSSNGNGGALTVAPEPPLYYAVEAIPYKLASGGTVLGQLASMRLLSALFGGVTVLFVYLFLRVVLPGHPWTWSVGALATAFHPLFAFITSGVNSDALLYPASAALLYLLAVALRRGLTLSVALALGATMAVGALTKFNFLGLMPATVVALVVASIQHEGRLSLRGLRLPAVALAIPAAAIALEMLLNAHAWDRPTIGASASVFSPEGVDPTIGGALGYGFQYYLAPLFGMHEYISSFPLRTHWLRGFVGHYGWLDTSFRSWVPIAALVPLVAIATLAIRALVVERAAVRQRKAELLCYLLLATSFMAFVALASYIAQIRLGANNLQVRYLFPLLALYAGGLALAARGAGARWAPVAGTLIVILAIAHNVFSQLLVLSRYYA